MGLSCVSLKSRKPTEIKDKVLQVPLKNVEASSKESWESAPYVKGIAKDNDRPTVIIDVGKLLEVDEIKPVKKVLVGE